MVERGRSKSLLAVTAAVARRSSYYLRWTKGRLPFPGVPEAGRRRERKTPWDPDFRLLPFISSPSYVAQPIRHMKESLRIHWIRGACVCVRNTYSYTYNETVYYISRTNNSGLEIGWRFRVAPKCLLICPLPPFFSSPAIRILSLLDYAS